MSGPLSFVLELLIQLVNTSASQSARSTSLLFSVNLVGGRIYMARDLLRHFIFIDNGKQQSLDVIP